MSLKEPPFSSRKFIAYLIAELTWKAIIVLMILNSGKIGDHLVMLTIVLIAGFIEVAYILGQAYVDSYMKIADNAFDKVKDAVEDVIPGKNDPEPAKPADPAVEPKKDAP